LVDPSAPKPVLSAIVYSKDELREEVPSDLAALRRSVGDGSVLWLDVAGLGDAETLRAVGAAFGLHPLALEDVVNVHQRPKVESYGEDHFLVARAIARCRPIETEQVSLFLHTVQILDLVETYRDIASGLTEIYLSSMSHRLNEVMKVLTIIATIFIPLTFVAGIYGMNFDRASPWNMPELGWRYGYPVCLLAMAALGAALYAWFRRKGWIGSDSGHRGVK
jgi:Mg2+ and Co2+ transporter CorA